MDSKTKIYFEVSWIFKDGQFNVDIYQDTFDYLQQMDGEDKLDLYSAFINAFEKECPKSLLIPMQVELLSQKKLKKVKKKLI